MPGENNNGLSEQPHDMAMLPSSESATLASSVFELDLYQELNSATGIAELGKKILGMVNQLGFSDCCFARTDIEYLGELVSLPGQLQKDYAEGGFFEHDLMADCANNNHFPIFGSVIEEYVQNASYESDLIRQNRERFRLLRSYGYLDGCIIPARQKKGTENVVLSIHSKGESPVEFRRKVEKNEPILRLIAETVDCITSDKFCGVLWDIEEVEDVKVGPRPLQLLTVLAKDDLTLNEAASKLCISIHTANQHIAAVRKAFGVHTTNGALCKAIKARLVKL